MWSSNAKTLVLNSSWFMAEKSQMMRQISAACEVFNIFAQVFSFCHLSRVWSCLLIEEMIVVTGYNMTWNTYLNSMWIGYQANSSALLQCYVLKEWSITLPSTFQSFWILGACSANENSMSCDMFRIDCGHAETGAFHMPRGLWL